MTSPRFLRAWSSNEGADRARAGFRARFGQEPAGVWAAPGRVNLIGEHTDYNGGICLPIALPQRTYFAATPGDFGSDTARLSSAQSADAVCAIPLSQVAPGAVEGWAAYAVGVLWALRRRGLPVPALTGHIDSCVPLGAGLSSSAALEVAVALAAVDLAQTTGLPTGAEAWGEATEARAGPPFDQDSQLATSPDALPDAVPFVALAADVGDGIGGANRSSADLATGRIAPLSTGSKRGRGRAESPGGDATYGTAGTDKTDGLGHLRGGGGQRLRRALAKACLEAENEIVGAPTGGMDQAAALLSAPGHAVLLDLDRGSAELIPFALAEAGLELLVIDTRAKHSLVDGQYGQRRATCERAAALLGLDNLGQLPVADLPQAITALGGPATAQARRVRHVVTEIERTRQFAAALASGEVALAGPLLDASHASLRDDYEVSAPELDLAVAAACGAGALGARMTGGGFGGSAIALVRQGQSLTVATQVAAAFRRAGWKEPLFLTATASGPGERVA
ncbi:MAG: hypothetical protein LBS27_04325 [Bifidobacteriaceae bacterium]|jgi:galactokinase|nr:hypothetical protein [Bifidobacteriaceae bacterium]